MFKLEVFKVLDSTNLYLKNIIENSSNEQCFNKCAVLALSQNAGVGKRGVNWQSPVGNMYLSFCLKEGDFFKKVDDITIISLLVGLVVRETIYEYVNDAKLKTETNILCKWVNDVLVDNKKISGVLLEVQKNKDNTNYLVVGIGVNLNQKPTVSKYEVTSLQEVINSTVDVEEFANKILLNFEKLLNNNKLQIVNMWKEVAYGISDNIKVTVGDKQLYGIFEDVTSEGYLILKTQNDKKIITAGEIFNIDKEYA